MDVRCCQELSEKAHINSIYFGSQDKVKGRIIHSSSGLICLQPEDVIRTLFTDYFCTLFLASHSIYGIIRAITCAAGMADEKSACQYSHTVIVPVKTSS